ncbi:YciI family protein [Nonomuraea sp. SYSU D8015]|uniref:YciI family protein n=1 Tax=Nonomuraea sp. SYSU D8015 TaxID=2593644 RepID=UPI00166021CE|nr:YciI family protein [Nonomuraea sp. SYSU D8015]
MKYVLMFVDTEEYAKELAAMTDEERAEAVRQVERWFADHAGKVSMGGSKLQPGHTATTVRLQRGAEPVITDGPFVEGKEVVSGFCEIEVEDLDEALRMVRTWPACPTVEIRPVQDMHAGR